MNIGIFRGINNKINYLTNKYESILEYNKISFSVIDVINPSFWKEIKNLSHFIYIWSQWDSDKQLAHSILPVIENNLLIKCLPDQNTCWHFDDKIKEYYLLASKGVPIAETWLHWTEESALKWLETLLLPVVFKLKGGAGSDNVVLVKTKAQARKLVRSMFSGDGIRDGQIPLYNNINYMKNMIRRTALYKLFKNMHDNYSNNYWQINKGYAYFQRFYSGNHYDTRVVVIGKRAFAFRRYVRQNDFRASGSKLIDVDPSKIDLRIVRMALDISDKLKFQMMAYDFLYDENHSPILLEISYTCPDKTLFSCPGYWTESLSWHPGKYWPQYFHLCDFLGMNLKNPAIE